MFVNPYEPANLARDRLRAVQWQQGYQDAADGKGLISSNGAWLEGWHDYHANKLEAGRVTRPKPRQREG